MDGHEVDRARTSLLARRFTVLTSVLILASTGAAYADEDPDIDAGKCQLIKFCVGVGADDETGGSGGHAGSSRSGSNGSKLDCGYARVEQEPPAEHPAWKGKDPTRHDLYFMSCSDGDLDNPDGFVVVPAGQLPVPQVEPQELAQRAVDSMTLLGPDIDSPRPAGKYVVGVPMWLWVNQSAMTYGPNTASASAGGLTVTATAKVSKIDWRMGDGSTVTCTGPGTPYNSSAGMAESPTCGHVYSKTSASAPRGKYEVTATSTWLIDWQGGGVAGQLTEIRQSDVQLAIGEVQVVR